jgi:hypothetical protein
VEKSLAQQFGVRVLKNIYGGVGLSVLLVGQVPHLSTKRLTKSEFFDETPKDDRKKWNFFGHHPDHPPFRIPRTAFIRVSRPPPDMCLSLVDGDN